MSCLFVYACETRILLAYLMIFFLPKSGASQSRKLQEKLLKRGDGAFEQPQMELGFHELISRYVVSGLYMFIPFGDLFLALRMSSGCHF